MKYRLQIMIVALLPSFLFSGVALAGTAHLMEPAQGDFAEAVSLRQLPGDFAQPRGPRGEPVQVFMDGDGPFEATPLRGPEAESQSYSLTASAEALEQGVTLALTAPGAVIRMVPKDGQAILDARSLQFQQGEQTWQGEAAIRDLAPADAAGPVRDVFGQRTLAFQLDDVIQAGELTVSLGEAGLRPAAAYRIHVFEPESAIVGELNGDSPMVVQGGTLALQSGLTGSDRLQVTSRSLRLRSPSGEVFPVELTSDGLLELPRPQQQGRGLWELEARLKGEGPHGPVQRDVRLAFEGVAPTARLNGEVQPRQAFNEWWLSVGVEVATAGRYEVRAALPGAGVAQSASWLEPGQQQLVLRFPGTIPAEVTLTDLRLLDQSRMSQLHVQAEGIQMRPEQQPRPIRLLGPLR